MVDNKHNLQIEVLLQTIAHDLSLECIMSLLWELNIALKYIDRVIA